MNQTFIAIMVGLIPALLWLVFWLREDSLHPEPKKMIFFTFIAGGISVIPSMYSEEWAKYFWEHFRFGGETLNIILYTSWAFIEEIFKYLLVFLVALRLKKLDDEPIDPIIYMITGALGFAAVENILFVLEAFHSNNFILGLSTGNFRFIGASLLHVVASSAIGVAIALTFYKSRIKKTISLFCGILVATLIHTVYNLYISDAKDNFEVFGIFACVWVLVMLLFAIFEYVKTLENKNI